MASVAGVDLTGHKETLTDAWAGGFAGLAWSPKGDEIWFTASPDGRDNAVRAVDMEGRQRLLLAGLTQLALFDVSPEGRILLGRVTHVHAVEALMAGHSEPQDVSLRTERSFGRFVTPDGQNVLVTDQSTSPYAAFLQRADGSLSVRLGHGDAWGLSPDGRQALAITSETPPRILLHSTGPGESKEVENPAQIFARFATWLPDGSGLVAFGPTPAGRSRGWRLDLGGGAPRPFTGEGVSAARLSAAVSPDGGRVAARDAEGRYRAYPLDGGPSELIPGIENAERVLQWADDGQALFLIRRAGPGWTVHHLDLQTVARTPWTEITPLETAGLRNSWVYLSLSGRFWVHSYSRLLTDLYVVEGIR